jgi:hypothetical protein
VAFPPQPALVAGRTGATHGGSTGPASTVPPELVFPELVFPELVFPELVLPELVFPELVLPELVFPELVFPLVVPELVFPLDEPFVVVQPARSTKTEASAVRRPGETSKAGAKGFIIAVQGDRGDAPGQSRSYWRVAGNKR